VYIKLPTYIIIAVDQGSRNLEPRSHPLFVAYTSRAESLPPLERVLPKLEKSCVGLCHLNFSLDEISNFEPSGASVACVITPHCLDDCGFVQFFQVGQLIDSRVVRLLFEILLDSEGFVLHLSRQHRLLSIL
jgi:hypothetical protein